MDILKASEIFYKKAQDISTQNMNLLIRLSQTLASPYVRDDLTSAGLIATLESKVYQFPLDLNWPITNDSAKREVTNLFNAVKVFYNSVEKPDFDLAQAKSLFNVVKNRWDYFKLHYFTDQLLLSMTQDYRRYTFWYDLKKRITNTLSSIDNILNQMVVPTNQLPKEPNV